MPTPDKEAPSRESKLAAMESALKDESASWMPKPSAEARFSVGTALGERASDLLQALEACLLKRGQELGAGSDEALLAAMGLLGGVLTAAANQSGWSVAQQEVLREWAIDGIRKLPFVTGEPTDAR